ncbi:MAG: cobamide remodeling phosphodiesterase CbiR [Chitinivibrionales bacterium]
MGISEYDTTVLKALPTIKKSFPFRAGCTSYVFPDHILPNVKLMAPFVDDFEIVLFESSERSNLPDKETIHELSAAAQNHDLSYTIHLPIDRKAASDDPVLEKGFTETAKRVIDLMYGLDPYAYILHLESVRFDSDREWIKRWEERSRDVCAEIGSHLLDESHKVCIENLGYPPVWNTGLACDAGLSLCTDIGHLWVYEKEWKGLIEKLLNKTRVVHLHGTSGRDDHLSLEAGDVSSIDYVLKRLIKGYSGVMTLEVFGRGDTLSSIRFMDRFLKES